MTTNAYILSWDMTGLESVVPITQYEDWDQQTMIDILAGNKVKKSPLNGIIQTLVLRARFNTQRHYEIYAIDCDASISAEDWRRMFDDNPQGSADLVRSRGVKIHSDRADPSYIKIV